MRLRSTLIDGVAIAADREVIADDHLELVALGAEQRENDSATSWASSASEIGTDGLGVGGRQAGRIRGRSRPGWSAEEGFAVDGADGPGFLRLAVEAIRLEQLIGTRIWVSGVGARARRRRRNPPATGRAGIAAKEEERGDAHGEGQTQQRNDRRRSGGRKPADDQELRRGGRDGRGDDQVSEHGAQGICPQERMGIGPASKRGSRLGPDTSMRTRGPPPGPGSATGGRTGLPERAPERPGILGRFSHRPVDPRTPRARCHFQSRTTSVARLRRGSPSARICPLPGGPGAGRCRPP